MYYQINIITYNFKKYNIIQKLKKIQLKLIFIWLIVNLIYLVNIVLYYYISIYVFELLNINNLSKLGGKSEKGKVYI